jgi:hypothetical protein
MRSRLVTLDFTIRARLVIGRLQPFAPGLFRFRRQQFFLRKALFQRELQRAVADQQHMRRFLHHAPRNRNRMRDVLDRGDRTAIALLVHDACIKRDVAVAIGIARAADAVIAQIHFRHPRPGLDRVERSAVLDEDFPSGLIRSDAEVPRRDDAGSRGRWLRRRTQRCNARRRQ